MVSMTGYTRNATAHNGLLDAITHLVSEPFTPQQIAAEREQMLRGQR